MSRDDERGAGQRSKESLHGLRVRVRGCHVESWINPATELLASHRYVYGVAARRALPLLLLIAIVLVFPRFRAHAHRPQP